MLQERWVFIFAMKLNCRQSGKHGVLKEMSISQIMLEWSKRIPNAHPVCRKVCLQKRVEPELMFVCIYGAKSSTPCLTSLRVAWFVCPLDIFVRGWNWFNLVAGSWVLITVASRPVTERIFSGLLALSIQVTEIYEWMPWIRTNIFPFCLWHVSLLCQTGWMPNVFHSGWEFERFFCTRLSLPVTRAVKPWDSECHGPSLILSSTIKLPYLPSCICERSPPVIGRKMAGSPLHAVTGTTYMFIRIHNSLDVL